MTAFYIPLYRGQIYIYPYTRRYRKLILLFKVFPLVLCRVRVLLQQGLVREHFGTLRSAGHNLGHFQVKCFRNHLICCLHIHTLDFMTTIFSYILSENLCFSLCSCMNVTSYKIFLMCAVAVILAIFPVLQEHCIFFSV